MAVASCGCGVASNVSACSVLFRPLIWPPPGPGFRTPGSERLAAGGARAVALQATLLQGSVRVENQDGQAETAGGFANLPEAGRHASRHFHFLLVVRLPPLP